MANKRQHIIEIIRALPDEALDEVENFALNVLEFYEIRENYNPPPLPELEEITLSIHKIISALPDEALDELEEDVIGLREFYEIRKNSIRPHCQNQQKLL